MNNKRPALLFLDVDGVLNDHKPHANGYCGLKPECVGALAWILHECPHVKIAVSSAWRYMVLNGDMSLRGFEYLLCIFGMPYDQIDGRVIGTTDYDDITAVRLGILDIDAGAGEGGLDYEWLKENGADLRAIQCEDFAVDHGFAHYVIVDDIEMETPHLYRTDPDRGLTLEDAREIIARLQ